MKKFLITFLIIFSARLSFAVSYPASCPAEGKAIVEAVGGCSAVDKSSYPSVHEKCCALAVPTTTKSITPTTQKATIKNFNIVKTEEYEGSVKFSWESSGVTQTQLTLICPAGIGVKNVVTDEVFECKSHTFSTEGVVYLKFHNISADQQGTIQIMVDPLNDAGSPVIEYRKKAEIIVTPVARVKNTNATNTPVTFTAKPNQNTTYLQNQINTILNLIKKLQEQLGGQKKSENIVPVSAPSSVNISVTENTRPEELGLTGNEVESFAYTWERDLYYGLMNDKDVIALQNALILQGCYQGPVTGNFFSLTRAGVVCFQKKNNFTNIPGSGYIGSYTRKVLNELYSK
ncbi:MAG: peptidoglycan-binding domain-containing protein [bacterium]|nr:peptidoglycan-binding domain-containing protein [bacterium]